MISRFALIVIGLSHWLAPAHADIEVVRLSGSIVTTELQEVNGKWRVQVTATGSPGAAFLVRATPDSEEIIEYIYVTAKTDTSQGRIDMGVLGEFCQTGCTNDGKVIRLEDVGVSSFVPGPGEFQAHLRISAVIEKDSSGNEGNLGGPGTTPSGLIEAHNATVFEVGGNVTAEIAMLSPITSGFEDIGFVAAGGSILNDITVPSGGITAVVANGGDVGTLSSPISINTAGTLEQLNVKNNVYAHINTRYNGASGDLGGLRSFTAGDIAGSVTTTDLVEHQFTGPQGISIADGDLTADVTITGDVSSGIPIDVDGDVTGDIAVGGDILETVTISGSLSGDVDADNLASGKTFEIGDTLTSTGSITLASGGLIGQIIINGANSSGTGSGDVTVGATTLSPEPLYTNTGLGGGAVGEVPFGLHLQACDPPYVGSTHPTATPAMPADTIDLVHYGPITGSGDLFLVGEFPGAHCSDPCLHGDISNHDDTANWDIVTTTGRTLTIERDGGLNLGKHYHIYPDDDLKSDIGLGGSNPAVRSWEYVIYRNSTP